MNISRRLDAPAFSFSLTGILILHSLSGTTFCRSRAPDALEVPLVMSGHLPHLGRGSSTN